MSSFIKNAWYVAMWAESLEQGKIVQREIAGHDIAIYRMPDATPVALDDRCPHRSAPLHMGRVCPNGNLQCGYHGLQFDATGACAVNPHGKGVIPVALRVRSFPVVERHSLIWVWTGEQPADPALIPDLSVIDRAAPRDVTYRDVLEMEANYQLVIDNLLDLSHVAFLHGGVLGNDSTVAADISVTQEGDSVTVSRWMPNVKPPGLFDMLYHRDGSLVDHWSAITWMAPSCLLNNAGVTAQGAPQSEGTGIFGLHLLTPVNERKTVYHFAAVRQNPLPFPDDVHAKIMEDLKVLRRKAFVTEDEPMIEAQQRVIDKVGAEAARPVLLAVDGGPVRYRRVLDEIRARQAALAQQTG